METLIYTNSSGRIKHFFLQERRRNVSMPSKSASLLQSCLVMLVLLGKGNTTSCNPEADYTKNFSVGGIVLEICRQIRVQCYQCCTIGLHAFILCDPWSLQVPFSKPCVLCWVRLVPAKDVLWKPGEKPEFSMSFKQGRAFPCEQGKNMWLVCAESNLWVFREMLNICDLFFVYSVYPSSVRI